MRKAFIRSVLGALLLAAVVTAPSVASTSGSYRLTKGAKKCRRGYVRQVRKHRAWCLVLTDTRLDTSAGVPDGGTTSWLLSGGLFYGVGADRGGGKELKGQPITYTIKDTTTGKVLGSFVIAASNFEAPCNISSSWDATGTVETLVGAAAPPVAACPLSPVTLPTADEASITGRYGGTGKYAPSVSFPAAI